jgi:UDP-N-acetylglucosamine 2-epimerase (hydrolysing)
MKRIVFLTGTRADFGKLKSLIEITQSSSKFETHIFVTGMHMNSIYGHTVEEVYKAGFTNIFQFINHDSIDHMDRILSKTIDGFSHYISQINPDLIIVHGDRVEAMAGAIVGSLNNILVAHVEGGEVSGTIDELIRHAVSKMSHVHFVASSEAKTRLIQLGELSDTIYTIGSPDLDLMNPEMLPSINTVKKHYNISFKDYAIAMFHPVTTEYQNIKENAKSFVSALLDSDENYIVIYPNNDLGSREILDEYIRMNDNNKIRIFPSIRFEYFLVFLKNAEYIIGNSSAGVREAPYYNTPTIDIGSRQNNRSKAPSIFTVNDSYNSILHAISNVKNFETTNSDMSSDFGEGDSDTKFLKILNGCKVWDINKQKQFQDLSTEHV